MRQIKLLIGTAIAIALGACVDWEGQEQTKYQYLDTIQNTLWYSYDTIEKVYYNIEYSDVKHIVETTDEDVVEDTTEDIVQSLSENTTESGEENNSDKIVEETVEWYDGKSTAYDSFERVNEIEYLSKDFIYTFIPAHVEDKTRVEAMVRVKFEDGTLYGGEVIPKGALQISNKEVYIIQLYQTDEKWEVLKTDDGTAKSSLMMWKE